MSNGQGTHALGSLLTATFGASFVAGVELDVDPMWSLVKKIVVVALGGVLAGIMHNLGARLASLAVTRGTILLSKGSILIVGLRKKSPTLPPKSPPPPPAK
jgi:hypothetical protein